MNAEKTYIAEVLNLARFITITAAVNKEIRNDDANEIIQYIDEHQDDRKSIKYSTGQYSEQVIFAAEKAIRSALTYLYGWNLKNDRGNIRTFERATNRLDTTVSFIPEILDGSDEEKLSEWRARNPLDITITTIK